MLELLRKFDHLIFYASDYRDINLAKAHGIEHFTIVPNGADEREFLVPADPLFRTRHGIAQDAFVVLTVSNLTGLKGHRELAEAFAIGEIGPKPMVIVLNGKRTGPTRWPDRLVFMVRVAATLRREEGVLRAVEKASNVTLHIKDGPRRVGDAAALVAETSRIRRVLKWVPRHEELEVICSTAYQWEGKTRISSPVPRAQVSG